MKQTGVCMGKHTSESIKKQVEKCKRKLLRIYSRHGARPRAWNFNFLTPAGKVDNVAIDVAVYINEQYLSGLSGLLQIDYEAWSAALNYSVRQIREAIARLRKAGLYNQYIQTERYKIKKRSKQDAPDEYGFISTTWIAPNTNKLSRAANGKMSKSKIKTNPIKKVDDLKSINPLLTPAHKNMGAIYLNNLKEKVTKEKSKNEKLKLGEVQDKISKEYQGRLTPVDIAKRLYQSQNIIESNSAINTISQKQQMTWDNRDNIKNAVEMKNVSHEDVRSVFEKLWNVHPHQEHHKRFFEDQLAFSYPVLVPLISNAKENGQTADWFGDWLVKNVTPVNESYEIRHREENKWRKKKRQNKPISFWLKDNEDIIFSYLKGAFVKTKTVADCTEDERAKLQKIIKEIEERSLHGHQRRY